MKVTVAICTWNRAKLLDQTLERMHSLRIPEGVEWELLVVDNNSTDDTAEVVARHADRLPLTRLVERKQGLSHARNCAVDAASGELLVWTDDDVLVDDAWLAEMVRAAQAWPDASYFGGRIDPWYESPPPAWIERNIARLEGVFVIRDLGPDERPLRAGEHIFGANMTFRTAVLRQRPFNPELGRVGANLISGEETSYIADLARAGHVGVWAPAARLQHFIPRQRMTRSYVWRHIAGVARSESRLNGDLPTGREFLGAPRWLYRAYAAALVKYNWDRLRNGGGSIESLQAAAHLQGLITECRHRSAQRVSSEQQGSEPVSTTPSPAGRGLG